MRFKKNSTEDALLISLMVFSPVFFGGVHVWAYSLIALISLSLFNLRFVFSGKSSPFFVFKKPESLAIMLFFAVCLMYLMPLPAGVIKSISPKMAELRTLYALSVPETQTLSVYPRATLAYIIKLASFIMVYLVVLAKIRPAKGEGDRVSRPRSVYPAFIMFGALAGVLSILFHSFVDFNLHIPANTLYFTLLLSIIAALKGKSQEVNYVFLNKLVNAIVIIGFCVSLFGIVQYFGWNGKMFWLVPKPGVNFGTFVCYNNFAGFIEMTSFMAIAMFYSGIFTSPLRHMRRFKDKLIWFSSPEANKTILYLFASVVMAGSIFLSRSRGGVISFALAFAVFALVCVGISPRTRKAKLSILGFVVLGLFIGMIMWLGPETTLNRFRMLPVMFRHIMEGVESAYLLRPLMWKDTLTIISHFPIAGAGFGGYSNIFVIERSFSASWGFLVFAHQDYLHLLAEMGAVGAAFFTAFFVWYLKRFRECLRRLSSGAGNLEK